MSLNLSFLNVAQPVLTMKSYLQQLLTMKSCITDTPVNNNVDQLHSNHTATTAGSTPVKSSLSCRSTRTSTTSTPPRTLPALLHRSQRDRRVPMCEGNIYGNFRDPGRLGCQRGPIPGPSSAPAPPAAAPAPTSAPTSEEESDDPVAQLCQEGGVPLIEDGPNSAKQPREWSYKDIKEMPKDAQE
ncbi:hypothetical protein HYDPIDRAFT_34679 [Hydnomerulius pinastri MD-312]|uniref:Uncharacterized protein n=1 Tax=Hydnomerulius pinastri MD-312 TaxID=994086 RepID=A0A0C9W5M2_9AGAM|nr:hypothetical protein HYDPIDRAFT_34679 [Hydnomerulius pinastri MD-312]